MYVTVGMKERDRMRKRSHASIERQEKELLAKRKPYKASQWCRDMAKQIKRDSEKKGGYKPSGAFMNELRKHSGTPRNDRVGPGD